MIRTSTKLLVPALLLVAAAAAGAAFAAASANVKLGPDRVAVNPKTYRFTVGVTCPAGGEKCVGVLNVETAKAVKPYSTQPKQVQKVGTFPYSVAPGKTQAVAGRMLGGGLAELLRAKAVPFRVTARDTASLQNVGTRVITFTLKR
jgi:hypothetical protein